MPYVASRGEWKYFNKKVPLELREAEIEDKKHIQFSLDTKCPDTAQKLAYLANDYIEAYWADLIENGTENREAKLKQAIRLAKLNGYRYKPAAVIATESVEEIVQRVERAAEKEDSKQHVAAVLGGAGDSAPKLSEALELFWRYAKPKIQNKSPEQIRVWKNSRRRAVNHFIKVAGDRPITEYGRADLLDFRDWWIDRIEERNLSNNTANDEITSFLKGVFKTLDTNHEPNLGLPIDQLFKELRLDQQKTRRPPYSREFVQNVLMSQSRLAGMNEDYRLIIYAFANTGAGPRELIMRNPEDIILDHEIPHIKIVQRQKDALKTDNRPRDIPLVGASLYAFQQRPEGFVKYRDSVNSVTTAIGKFLRENNLREKERQSLNSLRHTFQDRLTALKVGDRAECDLMGHSMEDRGRIEYGDGLTLEHKLEILTDMVPFEVID